MCLPKQWEPAFFNVCIQENDCTFFSVTLFSSHFDIPIYLVCSSRYEQQSTNHLFTKRRTYKMKWDNIKILEKESNTNKSINKRKRYHSLEGKSNWLPLLRKTHQLIYITFAIQIFNKNFKKTIFNILYVSFRLENDGFAAKTSYKEGSITSNCFKKTICR